MTTVATNPEALAAAYGLEAFYRSVVETFPCLDAAISRFLRAVAPETESDSAFLLIDLLSTVTTSRLDADESPVDSIRNMVQRMVSNTPSNLPISVQWKEVRRTLISDAEASTAGLDLSLLDEVP